MLNCCIQKKIQRETLYKGYTSQSNLDLNSSEIEAENNSDSNDQSESRTRSSSENTGQRLNSESSSADEEFYECEDSPSKSRTELEKDVDEKESESMDTSQSSEFRDSVSHKPEGRLSPCSNIKLLNHNEPLFIPITQEPAPMTEDMLEEHAEILAK